MLNLEGIFNRHEFQLKMNVHPNKTLQADWNESGGENFAFEILEEVPARENPEYDYQSGLEFLEDLWLEKFRVLRRQRLQRAKGNARREIADDCRE